MPVILDLTLEAYRLHSQRVTTLSYRTARERIVSFLIFIADRFGIQDEKEVIVIQAPFRQTDIASSVNATRETTSRELNNLRKKKLITAANGYIGITDLDKLKKLI